MDLLLLVAVHFTGGYSMKLILGLITVFISSATAFAQIPDEPYFYKLQADIGYYRIDRDDQVLFNVIGGTLTLDFVSDNAILILDQKIPGCERKDFCIQKMPPPIEVVLPIVSQEVIQCGIIQYIAQSDMEGSEYVKHLIIQDFRDFDKHCKSFLPVPETSIRFVHQEQRALGLYKLYEAYFEATLLRRIGE
jgi:hypothetical protein